MLIVFIFIAGLRYRLGVDTTRYLYKFYYLVPKLSELTIDDFSFGSDPLWLLFNSLVLTFGGHFYIVQLLHATFVNFLLFKYINKHTRFIFTSIFFYFIYQYSAFNMEEMRASMSIVVCLFANDYIIEKKRIKGLLLYFIAALFHISTIVIIIMSLFYFLRFNKYSITVLIASFLMGFVLRPYAESLVFMMDMGDIVNNKAMNYVTNDHFMEGNMNIFGIISLLLIYSYGVVSFFIIRRTNFLANVNIFEPFIIIFLLFGLLSINVEIVYRFARFYVVYYIILVSSFVVYSFSMKSPMLSRGVVYIRACLIMMPLLFFLVKIQMADNTRERYLPYSSVIEKSIDTNREKIISFYEGPPPSTREY